MSVLRMKRNSYDFLCEIYTLSLILMPILGVYYFKGIQITLSDVFTFAVTAFIFVHCIILARKNSKFTIELSKPLLIFLVYILFRFIIILPFERLALDHMWSTLKYCWGIAYVVLFAKNFFKVDFAIKGYTAVSLFVSIYGILQYVILKLFRYYLTPAFLSFLGFRVEASQIFYQGATIGGYLSSDYNKTSFFRVRSCLSEPSHLAEFLIVFLLIDFFIVGKEKNYPAIVLSMITLILSSSTTAYGCLIVFSIIWLIKNIKTFSKKKIIIFLLVAVPTIILACVFIAGTDVANVVYRRVFSDSSAIDGRIGDYFKVNEVFKNGWEYVFGKGIIMDVDAEYGLFLPSVPRFILFYGYSGIVIFMLAAIFLYKKSPKPVRILSLYLFMISLFDMIFFHHNILFTFALIIALCKKEKNTLESTQKERIL